MATPDFILALRAKVGHDPLWLSGCTAVIRRVHEGTEQILLVRRADNLRWTPVTGIVDPGEHPAVTAQREALEEAGVHIRVDRLAAVSVVPELVYPNGDVTAYLDLAFECTWVAGEAYVADDESVDVRWWPVDDLPDLTPEMVARVDAALSGEERARI